MADGRLDLRSLQPGDRVQHELLVRDRQERKTAAGDPFWILTLGNATGTIDTAPVWSDRRAWAEGAERGAVVQAIGDVSSYQGKRQLALTAPLRVIPREGLDLAAFLPHVPAEKIAAAWAWIDKQVAEIRAPALRRAAALFFGDAAFREAFERAPGSTIGHHATVGGLLEHVVEVAHVARQTALIMKADADLALVGALLHDIGKVEAYEVGADGFTNTRAGHLAGHVVLGTWMLQRRLHEIPDHGLSEAQVLELQHFILSHHGSLEFGAAVVPLTPEAEIVHWADEASAKTHDMQAALADTVEFPDGEEFAPKRLWRVGRRPWRRPDPWG